MKTSISHFTRSSNSEQLSGLREVKECVWLQGHQQRALLTPEEFPPAPIYLYNKTFVTSVALKKKPKYSSSELHVKDKSSAVIKEELMEETLCKC